MNDSMMVVMVLLVVMMTMMIVGVMVLVEVDWLVNVLSGFVFSLIGCLN